MKTLLVMRHAKSDWGAAFTRDHDRPLNSRGEKASRRMGRFLADAETTPDLVISSTAVRALSTAELAADAGDWNCPIITNHGFYASDPEQVLEIVAEVDPAVECLLIAGHEPTWSALTGRLIGGGRIHMPTAAVACLELPHGSWTDLPMAVCALRWFATPKMLKKK